MNYHDLYDDSKRQSLMRKARKFAEMNKKLVVVVILTMYVVSRLASVGSTKQESIPGLTMKESELEVNFKTFGMDLQKRNELPAASATLREKLSFYFPYDPEKPVPNQIWQTWKVDINDKSFPRHFRKFQETWPQLNSGYTYHLIPDSIVDEFMRSLFANVPEVIAAYNMLPKNILKADFFRYLVIFARGGTYSDIDTICLKPVNEWATFNEQTVISHYLKTNGKTSQLPEVDPSTRKTPIGLTIGIEADPDRPDWHEWYARRIQFCQWTIQGKQGHPMLRELIIRIVEQTFRKEAMGNLKKVEGKDMGGDIMQWTGPGVFTDTLFDYLNNVVSDGKLGDGYGVGSKYWNSHAKYKLSHIEVDANNEPMHSDKQTISWKSMSKLSEPLIIDDVMILPITSFSPGVGQMGSHSPDHPLAFVRHMFQGSWKPDAEKM
uniref:Alpha-1,6-mannosyltransferase n=1 Tax=Ogataea minuta TaxID=36026 RepID=Q1JUK8_9ASCO|nr:alpha-1,6-mannosyltransferase [Ogataea minuta]